MKKVIGWSVLGLLVINFLAGCGTTPRYEDEPKITVEDKSGPAPAGIKDSGPTHEVDVEHIPDAIPQHEMVKLSGNATPYTIAGKTYHVNFDTRGFTQTGYASWYGNKFHGRKTSNGETYDMYAMSGAHKTLPIPCYVEVTNLENNKKVVVRVNDRGPFHGGRIIDLSYTAAKKLGFHNKGTTKVRIEVISTEVSTAQEVGAAKQEPSQAKLTYLQLGAFSKKESADKLKNQAASLTKYPILIRLSDSRKFYRVLIGPLLDNFDLLTLRQTLLDKNIAQAHVVEM